MISQNPIQSYFLHFKPSCTHWHYIFLCVYPSKTSFSIRNTEGRTVAVVLVLLFCFCQLFTIKAIIITLRDRGRERKFILYVSYVCMHKSNTTTTLTSCFRSFTSFHSRFVFVLRKLFRHVCFLLLLYKKHGHQHHWQVGNVRKARLMFSRKSHIKVTFQF